MTSAEYRIESNRPLSGRFLPEQGSRQYLVSDRALAVALAAKSANAAGGEEVRVVYVPTGEIVFRKAESSRSADMVDDL